MNYKYLFIISIFSFITACSDDISGVMTEFSKETKDGKFLCKVEMYKDEVVQTIIFKDSVKALSGIIYNGDGTATVYVDETYENISKSKMEKICEDLKEEESRYDKNSFYCADKKAGFKMTLREGDTYDLSSIAYDMQSECKDFYEEWENLQRTLKQDSLKNDKQKENYDEYKDVVQNEYININDNKNDENRDENLKDDDENENKNDDENDDDTEIIKVYKDTDAEQKKIFSSFKKDENTIFFDNYANLDTQYENLKTKDDYVISLNKIESYSTGLFLNDEIEKGSFEFFFRPHENFFGSPHTLIGNDASRLLVIYNDDRLVFMMNKTNMFSYVISDETIKNDWNYVSAEWDGINIYLYLNGKLIGEKEVEHGYEPSFYEEENEIIIGKKSDCCMEGLSLFDSLKTDADFGPIRVSNILREGKLK